MKEIARMAGLEISKEARNEILCICPDCQRPKLTINKKTGQWQCFIGCNNGNAYTMLRDMTHMKHAEIMQILQDHGLDNGYQRSASHTNDPDKKPKIEAKDTEPLDDSHAQRLCKAKNLDPATLSHLQAYKLKDKDIAILPGFDPNHPAKACGWIRVHLDGKPINGTKYPVLAGSQPGLLGLKTLPESDTIVFCEGWKDMLAARSQGYAALTNTQGVKTWRDSWGKVFKGKHALIIFDRDKAGETAEPKIAEHIAKHALSVKIARLPYEYQETGGKDLHDYVRDDGGLITALPAEDYVPQVDPNDILLSDEHPETIAIAFARWSKDVCKLVHRYNHTDEWSIYKDGKYQQVEDIEITGYIRKFLTLCKVEKKIKKKVEIVRIDSNKKTKSFVANILEWLKTPGMSLAHIRPSLHAPSSLSGRNNIDNIIAMQNGLLDITDRNKPVLMPFNDDIYTFNYLPFDYDPEATCPTIEKSLGQYFQDDDGGPDMLAPPILYAWIKKIITRDTSAQKIFSLVGPPRSGKGTLGRIISNMIGTQNIGTMTITSLSAPFPLEPLLNKQLGIMWDASVSGRNANVTAAVEALKSISGEDRFSVNRKNQKALSDVQLKMNILMIANKMLDLKDSSGALANRFNFLETTHSFLGHEEPGIEKKMMAEIPGLFNKALAAAEGAIAEHPRGLILKDEFAELSSPYHAFVNECCVISKDHFIPTKLLWLYYCEWCDQNEQKIVSPQAFKINFNGQPGVSRYRPRLDDQAQTYLVQEHDLDQIGSKSLDLSRRPHCYKGIDIMDTLKGVWSWAKDNDRWSG